MLSAVCFCYGSLFFCRQCFCCDAPPPAFFPLLVYYFLVFMRANDKIDSHPFGMYDVTYVMMIRGTD